MVKKAVKIIEGQYCRIKSVQSVADILGVTLATLSRLFCKECNAGLLNYIRFLKIREAVCLMNNPGLRLRDIAEKTGFTDKVHFNKCFKRFVGLSPSEFRKRKLEIDFRQIFAEKVKKKHEDQK